MVYGISWIVCVYAGWGFIWNICAQIYYILTVFYRMYDFLLFFGDWGVVEGGILFVYDVFMLFFFTFVGIGEIAQLVRALVS